jgi:hypothetical protein
MKHAQAIGVLLSGILLVVVGCGDGQKCIPEDHTTCQAEVVYWVDSCGQVGEQVEACECGCNQNSTLCMQGCCRTSQCAHLGPNYYCDLPTAECLCGPDCSDYKCCGDDGCGGTCPQECPPWLGCDLETCTCG